MGCWWRMQAPDLRPCAATPHERSGRSVRSASTCLGGDDLLFAVVVSLRQSVNQAADECACFVMIALATLPNKEQQNKEKKKKTKVQQDFQSCLSVCMQVLRSHFCYKGFCRAVRRREHISSSYCR